MRQNFAGSRYRLMERVAATGCLKILGVFSYCVHNRHHHRHHYVKFIVIAISLYQTSNLLRL